MRTPRITRDDLELDDRHIWDEIADKRPTVGGPFQVLLNCPDLAERVTNVGTLLRFDGNLPDGIRELAIISTAREFDAVIEWAAHTPLARKGGVSETAIEVVRDRLQCNELEEAEAIVIEYCRELFGKRRVSQVLFDKAHDLFGTQSLVELTVLMGYYSMIACCLNAFEVEVGPEFKDHLPV